MSAEVQQFVEMVAVHYQAVRDQCVEVHMMWCWRCQATVPHRIFLSPSWERVVGSVCRRCGKVLSAAPRGAGTCDGGLTPPRGGEPRG